jgi:hypothetical protein
MAFTHTKKVKIGIFLKARIRIRSQMSGSDQKGSDPTGSGSATLTVGLEPEPHSNLYPEPKMHKNDAAPLSSVADPDPDLCGRIRMSRTGSGSCLNKRLFINFSSVCKSHKYLGNLCFLRRSGSDQKCVSLNFYELFLFFKYTLAD